MKRKYRVSRAMARHEQQTTKIHTRTKEEAKEKQRKPRYHFVCHTTIESEVVECFEKEKVENNNLHIPLNAYYHLKVY